MPHRAVEVQEGAAKKNTGVESLYLSCNSVYTLRRSPFAAHLVQNSKSNYRKGGVDDVVDGNEGGIKQGLYREERKGDKLSGHFTSLVPWHLKQPCGLEMRTHHLLKPYLPLASSPGLPKNGGGTCIFSHVRVERGYKGPNCVYASTIVVFRHPPFLIFQGNETNLIIIWTSLDRVSTSGGEIGWQATVTLRSHSESHEAKERRNNARFYSIIIATMPREVVIATTVRQYTQPQPLPSSLALPLGSPEQ